MYRSRRGNLCLAHREFPYRQQHSPHPLAALSLSLEEVRIRRGEDDITRHRKHESPPSRLQLPPIRKGDMDLHAVRERMLQRILQHGDIHNEVHLVHRRVSAKDGSALP